MAEKDMKFYKHREWKPGADAAPEARPVKLMNSEEAAKHASPTNSTGGSAWNSAGTWEERSQKTWAEGHLKKLLVGLTANHEGYGEVRVSELAVTGDASVTFTRGKKKFPFDFSLEFTIVGPEDVGMKCQVTIPDFACDEDAPYEMDFSWKGDKDTQKPEAKAAVGATAKQVKAGTGLFAEVHRGLAQWVVDFIATC